jgi:hypothetical protein
MKVVLTRKLADHMDGIDVADYEIGDVLDLPARDAELLIAEQWAIPDRRREGGVPPSVERRKTTRRRDRDFTEEGVLQPAA